MQKEKGKHIGNEGQKEKQGKRERGKNGAVPGRSACDAQPTRPGLTPHIRIRHSRRQKMLTETEMDIPGGQKWTFEEGNQD